MFEQTLNLVNKAAAFLTKKRSLQHKLQFRNPIYLEIWRQGKLYKKLPLSFNDVTNEGKNYILDVMFNGGTQIAQANWALGLVNNAGFTAFNAGDTMASHGGWTEFTGYTEATRPAWGPGAAASQSVTNAVAATFTINASATLKGIFVTSNNTKGGTTGTLWATAAFASTVDVVSSDELKVTYTISA